MRAVSFVERLEFDFSGSVFRNGLAFGDVDNDRCNELVVANENGEVFIFKGSANKCWRKACDLGMVKQSFLIHMKSYVPHLTPRSVGYSCGCR